MFYVERLKFKTTNIFYSSFEVHAEWVLVIL
jgi:hypothetical protein